MTPQTDNGSNSSIIHPSMHPFFQSFIHSLIHSFIHSLIHSFIYLFIFSSTQFRSSLINPFVHSLSFFFRKLYRIFYCQNTQFSGNQQEGTKNFRQWKIPQIRYSTQQIHKNKIGRKVISLVKQSFVTLRSLSNEPIKSRSKYMLPAPSTEKRFQVLLLIGR